MGEMRPDHDAIMIALEQFSETPAARWPDFLQEEWVSCETNFQAGRDYGFHAGWAARDAIIATLTREREELARQLEEAQKENHQLRTDLANSLLASLIKTLNDMDEVPRSNFRQTANARLLRKWLTAKEEKADG